VRKTMRIGVVRQTQIGLSCPLYGAIPGLGSEMDRRHFITCRRGGGVPLATTGAARADTPGVQLILFHPVVRQSGSKKGELQ
jgi:hypothetical protein